MWSHKRMSEEATNSIGRRLREVRGGMSQAEFADILEVHQNTIVNYESGKRLPDASVISKLFEKMHVDPTWLVTGKRESITGLSDEESELVGRYRNAGEHKNVIHTVVEALANLEKGKQ